MQPYLVFDVWKDLKCNGFGQKLLKNRIIVVGQRFGGAKDVLGQKIVNVCRWGLFSNFDYMERNSVIIVSFLFYFSFIFEPKWLCLLSSGGIRKLVLATEKGSPILHCI